MLVMPDPLQDLLALICHFYSKMKELPPLYSQSPTEGARKALVLVLGYLAKTPDFRIEGQIHGDGDKVEVYSDSDHGGDKHVTTRSHTGNLICLNGVPVHWRSAKQPVTSYCFEQCGGRNIRAIRSSEMWAIISMGM